MDHLHVNKLEKTHNQKKKESEDYIKVFKTDI
jgi:hypothetical protein